MENIQDLLNRINEDLKKILSEKRYNHSIGVMKKAEQLAQQFKVDVDKAMLVGIAHDIAKEMPAEEKIKYVKDHKIEIDEIEEVNIDLLHAKIGADICREKYGFSQDMQDAIKYHTTGNPDMSDLAKVILIADKIEDGRTTNDYEIIKDKEKEGLNAILIYVLDNSIKYTINKGKKLHLDSIKTRNRFLEEK